MRSAHQMCRENFYKISDGFSYEFLCFLYTKLINTEISSPNVSKARFLLRFSLFWLHRLFRATNSHIELFWNNYPIKMWRVIYAWIGKHDSTVVQWCNNQSKIFSPSLHIFFPTCIVFQGFLLCILESINSRHIWPCRVWCSIIVIGKSNQVSIRN